jgi:hypothetical protein
MRERALQLDRLATKGLVEVELLPARFAVGNWRQVVGDDSSVCACVERMEAAVVAWSVVVMWGGRRWVAGEICSRFEGGGQEVGFVLGT